MQTACYQTEARLTEARKQLAELNVEVERTRGRLEYQAKQSAASSSGSVREKPNRKLWNRRWRRSRPSSISTAGPVADLEVLTATARQRSIEKNEAREVLPGQSARKGAGLGGRPAGRAAAARGVVHLEESAGADRRVSGRHRA